MRRVRTWSSISSISNSAIIQATFTSAAAGSKRGTAWPSPPPPGTTWGLPDVRFTRTNFFLSINPFRSQTHGERKVLRDRSPRWNQQERARGWHRQYDEVETARFLRDRATL